APAPPAADRRAAAAAPPARRGAGFAPPTLLAESGERGFLSPRVRRLIAEHGLKTSDLAFIVGTGAGGRITAADVERYVASGEPLPPIRQAVAAGMTKSWTRPLATVAMPLALEPLLAHRRQVPGRPSLTVYALRALAVALAAGSPFARRLTGTRLHAPASIDLAVAVEVEGGVLTPVIRRVEHQTLAALTEMVEAAIARARQGTVADAGEAVGAVSNYGVFGIAWATPIPLPGHSVILGIGAPHDHPVWDPQQRGWGRERRVELTLTFDHRLADGGDAARLLARIVDGLAHPERL
ncbi:MAG: 2-oxo acid dehydrogenase subunit E2, partial [Planctomycetes bacterium]|nr:2-oxo acid dehydrogenase subunit E2 [Planctomycetota bacterium]